MSLLTSKFDVLRGYPNGSALAWPFKIKLNGTTPYSLAAGDIVTQELQSGVVVVNKATTPNTSIADPVDAWLVVEGNDDFSGSYTGKCACVKLGTGVIFQVNYSTQCDAGSYTCGVAVTMNAGKLKVKGANEQIIGHVLEDLSATTGVVIISA